MKGSVIYSNNSGEILEVCAPPLSSKDIARLEPGLGFIHVESIADDFLDGFYIDNDVPTPKALMSLSVSGPVVAGDDWVVTGIPTGATVKYPGGEIVVNDGYVSWSSLEPGRYPFEIKSVPYITEVVYAEITSA
ncbi:hypothetical protein [Gilvimarinus chinensis]|uniref:hypothetical protein n=1 Tax=Gilvimarinus chinensis TaxID=396005 RepID=UPI0003658CFA|nr:hypothetical protein [Gilvimarinus chinensis]